jgi:hypothetical protein
MGSLGKFFDMCRYPMRYLTSIIAFHLKRACIKILKHRKSKRMESDQPL